MQEISLLPTVILALSAVLHFAAKTLFKSMSPKFESGYWSIVIVLSTWQLFNFAISFDEVGEQYLLDNLYGIYLGMWLCSSLIAIYNKTPLRVLGVAFSIATGVKIATDILFLGVFNPTYVTRMISIPSLVLIVMVTALAVYKGYKNSKPNLA